MECSLCSLPIKVRVLMPCGHSDICLTCYLRFSACYHCGHCYFCQKEFTTNPIATSDLKITYKQARWHELRENQQYQIDFFEPAIAEEILTCNLFKCHDCSAVFTHMEGYASHVKSHKKTLCKVCTQSGRFLPCDAQVFFSRDYSVHMKHHPKCPSCSYQAFDIACLEKHCQDRHERCDICARVNKILWFKDRAELIRHNESQHFVCHHTTCSSDTLIAFATRGELLLHLQQVHGEKNEFIDITKDFEDNISVKEEDSRARIVELNKRFVDKLNSVLSDNPNGVDELKQNARLYIENSITTQDFYNKFSEICGDHKYAIFCDMVAIMPDPQKRAELLRLHENFNSAHVRQVQQSEEAERRESTLRMMAQKSKAGQKPQAQPSQQPAQKRKKGKKIVITNF